MLRMLLLVSWGLTLAAQTQVDLRTQARNIDFSAANSTRPIKTGTALPATCVAGNMFFKTDAPGAGDIIANASPVDPTRGLFKWASAMQGQAATQTGAQAAFLGCQNLAWCISQLEWWVRQGYQPANLALKGKAHDGGVVGVTGALGSGYSGACSASVAAADSDDLGSGAALTCSFSGGVPVVTVVNPGSHYRIAMPAVVTIAGTGGSGASLNVLVSPSDIGPVPITLFASVAP